MKNFFLNVTVVFGILTLAASCLKSGDTSNPVQGALLVANYSPDAPAINISLNTKPYISNLLYYSNTAYFLQTGGSYNVGITDASNNSIASHTITIEPNKYFSYFVIDSFAKLKYAFMEDKLAMPGTDSAYLRFLDFSPDAGIISLKDSASHKYFDSARSFNDQSSNAAKANFKQIKQGIFTLQLVKLVNTDTVVIATRKDTLAPGHNYTIIARGFLNGTGSKAIAIEKITNY